MPHYHRHTPAWPLIKRLAKNYLLPHLKPLAGAHVLMILAAASTAALAKLMEPIINRVFKASDVTMLYEIALVVLAVFVVRGFATYGHTVVMNKFGQRVVADVQQHMLRHLLRADLSYFHNHASGQLQSRMVNDVGVMRIAVAEVLTSVGKSTFTLIFLVAVMFYQDWRLALIAFIAFPIGGYAINKLSRRLRRVATDTQAELGTLSAQLTQTFQSVRHIKAYNREAAEGARIGSVVERLYRLSVKAFRVGALATPLTEIFSGLAIVTVIIYGGIQVMEGVKTPGALFSFITAFLLAYEPMKKMGKANAQLQAGLSAADRVFAVIDSPPTITDSPSAVPLASGPYTVAFNAVSFTYEGAEQPALNSISINVPAGQTAALVGMSGSGKTTMLNLIPRFYDVSAGAVMVAGQDVRGVTLESLRDKIALVAQDVILFDDSVRANIEFGRTGASEEQIIAAAKAAQAHEFILQLPQGYDTVIGELGTKISGGQRQRLAIARAILKNAPILLLDEATSALDAESERAVQAALHSLAKGRTTIVVAHRLSTIIEADCIYVLERGQVVESGTHAELLARRGAYYKLYGTQQTQVAELAAV